MPSLGLTYENRKDPDSVSPGGGRPPSPASLRKQVLLAPLPLLLSFPAGSRCQAPTPCPWEGAWLHLLAVGKQAFPGEDGMWACADPCLPLLSDLFPLIFPAGKWAILSQWVGTSSPGPGAMGSAI